MSDLLSASFFSPAQREMVSQTISSKRLSDEEHEQHIFDTERLWRVAYQRFQDFGLPADRDEALLWLHRQNQAILARSVTAQAARHAAFERRLDEGVCYFSSQHAIELGQQLRRAA